MNVFKLALGLLFIPTFIFAQHKWESGVFLGTSTYQGDLVKTVYPNLEETNFAIGILNRYHFNHSWAARLNVLVGKLSGDDWNYTGDPDRLARAFNFETVITEVSILGEWELFGKRRYPETGGFINIFSPYFFGGIGMIFTDPTTDFSRTTIQNGQLRELEEDQENTTASTNIAIPLGVGLNMDLNERSKVGLEMGFRITNTDYIDGVSQAGEPTTNDIFLFAGINLSLRFGSLDTDGDGVADNKDNCPELAGLESLSGCPDSDNDGIPDFKDKCPLLKGVLALRGCPDLDGDGVEDSKDACPNVAGLRPLNGCPDLDKDGVTDSEDKCPNEVGLRSLKGCPDSDEDGIADYEDACPDKAGILRTGGCPTADSDGDGWDDDQDKCPRVKGLYSLQGCPDKDGDGIADPNDRCPNNKGTVDNEGCPLLEKEEQELLEFAAKNIQFETASAILKSKSQPTLDKIANILLKYSDYKLRVSGHTDSVGPSEPNLLLSEERAKACYDFLLGKGIEPDRIYFVGYGETQPIADNKTSSGRRLNRRVEFELFLHQPN